MDNSAPKLPRWTIAAPLVGWLMLALSYAGWGGAFLILMVLGLMATVIASVHHAEVLAHRTGEPLGTLLLAIAVTVIEVGLIVALMLAGGEATKALARDTVFAAVMLILNGIVGACLLLGGTRHREQSFVLFGTSAALTTLSAICVMTMVLPNFTQATLGPTYSPKQLVFISVVSLVLYGTFLLVQTVRHRDYFLPPAVPGEQPAHCAKPSGRTTAASAALLVVGLVAVVLLAKALAPAIEHIVVSAGAPKDVVGIIIAAVVLLPEGTAALRAAYQNRLQTSLNLALGSALASIGLTIPTVAVVSILTGWQLELGLSAEKTVLLLLSLFCASMSLATGRTTVLQGAVQLVLCAVYLFFAVVP